MSDETKVLRYGDKIPPLGPYFVKKRTIPEGIDAKNVLGDPTFYHTYENFIHRWLDYLAGKYPKPVVKQPLHDRHLCMECLTGVIQTPLKT